MKIDIENGQFVVILQNRIPLHETLGTVTLMT